MSKQITVTDLTNFVRIFRLPSIYPGGFCFGGGYPTEFWLVDWFNPFPQEDFWESKTHKMKKLDNEEAEKHRDKLRDFIKDKKYFQQYPDSKFLAITDYDDVFFI